MLIRAQAPQPSDQTEPAFEVASVKLNTSGDLGGGISTPFNVQEFRARNLTTRRLILQAFGVSRQDLIGGPAWIDQDRFDIVAKSVAADSPKLPMLRTLLADRFKLRVHHETRERPVYALVVARADGQLGTKLRRLAIDCLAPRRPGDPPVCNFVTRPDSIRGQLQIAVLASLLSPVVQQKVVDRTGLTGNFEVDLQWTPDGLPGGPPDAPRSTADQNGPSIFTAMQEQLGLKLESTRGPVDVLVIDYVDPPQRTKR